MTNKNLPTNPKWKTARLTNEAHDNLVELRELLTEEKEMGEVTHIQAASFAINDTIRRIRRRRERRQQSQPTRA